MYEEACYEKAFLKEVIVRVDFAAPIAALGKVLPSKLATEAAKIFPIVEPADQFSLEIEVVPNKPAEHRETRNKQWNLFGLEKEKQLALAPSFVFLDYHQYTTFEKCKEEFALVIDALKKEFPDTIAGRFGLRYINTIEEPDASDPTDWSEYIAPELLVNPTLFDCKCLARLMHVAELKYDDISLRFQYGMPNPDHPAVIRRGVFVLDLDGSVRTAHSLSESLDNMVRAHEIIQDRFERSITGKLRERMNAKAGLTH